MRSRAAARGIIALKAKIWNNPELDKYILNYGAGQTLFLEGDESQDLYILLEGELDIYKGQKKIAAIVEAGAIFGEMSFLLGKPRTATVKARTPIRCAKVPRPEIHEVLGEFTEAGREIIKILAQRLDATGRIVQGLKEFVDQLPEAVIITDMDGKLLTWNDSAVHLYGGDWGTKDKTSAEKLYAEPSLYREFMETVQSDDACAAEKVLEINHPTLGKRFVELKMTCLYDPHQNFQGVLSLGRDVTQARKLERKLKLAWMWLVPSLVLAGFLTVAVIFGLPYFSKGYQAVDLQKNELRNQLGRDFKVLSSFLQKVYLGGDQRQAMEMLSEFLELRDAGGVPYVGVVLLDPDKRVISAFVRGDLTAARRMVGTSYGRLNFQGPGDSLHKVLSVYRTHPDKPGSYRSLEMAFAVNKNGQQLGWLVFILDADELKKTFDADESTLLHFKYRPK